MAKRRDVSQEDHLGPVKKPKRECKYQSEWRKNGVLPSRKGPTFASCESYGVDINIGHGGLNDTRKHIATSKHQEILKRNQQHYEFVEESITRAEVIAEQFCIHACRPFHSSCKCYVS